ncbi:MAG: alpha/beta fold hydrolase [Pseudohongiellaceae bacterium]
MLLFAGFGCSLAQDETDTPVVQNFSPISALAPASLADPVAHKLDDIEFLEVNLTEQDGLPRRLLLFVHGTPGSARAFMTYLTDPLLQQQFHLISVTRAGWINDADEKRPLLTEQARTLEPLLNRNQSEQGAILMGHSFGGPVIARTAMDYPELVGGLVFVASTGNPELSGPRWYNRIAVILPRFVLGSNLKGANAEIMPLRPQLEEMLPRWSELRMPVLIVQGDRDRLVYPGNADFLREQLINADVSYLRREDQGHFVLWEESDLIRDALLEKFAN